MKFVTIIGLGYVGFPLAQLCLKKGMTVYGIDISEKTIEKIKNKIDPVEGKPIEQTFDCSVKDEGYIEKSDCVIICVPTPVDSNKYPDLRPVKSAVKTTIEGIGKNKPLVVVESTINPGVMEDIVKPMFDEAKLNVGEEYYLTHCPERINPGDPKWNVSNIPRVIGAFTSEGLEKAHNFYSEIIDGKITKMSSIRAAEACKVVENAFRDINIAFVNELAKSFQVMDIDVKEVIDGASTKPFAFLAHYPGCGVGGHCIPVDPYYLIERAKTKGFDHKFLRLAREINESMPKYTVGKIQELLNENELPMKNTKIGLLGLSYKANVGDDRESPSFTIKKILQQRGAKVITYDPYLECDADSLEDLQKQTDILLLATNHKEFQNIDWEKVKIFVDGRNMFSDKKIPENVSYLGIGRY